MYYFVEKSRKYTCVNCTPVGSIDLSSDGIDVLINDIKDHLVEVETINQRLQVENTHLRNENIQVKNNLKVEKNINKNNIKELDTKIKKLQTKLSETNRISAEKTREIKRLKTGMTNETIINGTPSIVNVSIDEDMNVIRNEKNEDHFMDEYTDFKKFVTLEFQKVNQKIAKLEKQHNTTTNISSQHNNVRRSNIFEHTNRFQSLYTEPIGHPLEDSFEDNCNIQTNNFRTKNTRRPSPVVNQHPERDILPTNLSTSRTTQPVIPGTNYNNAVNFGRKTYVLGTSMIKGIPRKMFNPKLKRCSARFRPFIGATLKQMETYVQPIINDDTPDVLIFQIECNNIGNIKLSEREIAEWIVMIGRQCKESNVNHVFISSVICRAQTRLNAKVKAVNNILKEICRLNGLGFVDNSNIGLEHLYEDGLHLNDDGKALLADNFIYVLNNFVL